MHKERRNRGKPTAVIVTDRRNEHDEGEFVRGTQPDPGPRAEKERADVERAASAVRGDVVDILSDSRVHGVNKQRLRDFGDDEAVGGRGHTGGVLIGTKHGDRAVLAAERLEALETGLPVVQRRRSNMQPDVRVRHGL